MPVIVFSVSTLPRHKYYDKTPNFFLSLGNIMPSKSQIFLSLVIVLYCYESKESV